ncbi:MAG TPA: hypothetical protein G4O12_02915 [Dehalococcoidia bacterium]|nr:hypothetical protein [Dehalococcoidia bacterium]
MDNLERLAQAIKQKNLDDTEIARIVGQPAERSHGGEYIAAHIFGITLEQSASQKGIDGRFVSGSLTTNSVNIKWYGKMEGLLDVSPDSSPDFYLVMTGPKAAAVSSRGTVRPWVISYVYLFDAVRLIGELKRRGVKIGIATSVHSYLWEVAEIYPVQRSKQLLLSDDQKNLLALFS